MLASSLIEVSRISAQYGTHPHSVQANDISHLVQLWQHVTRSCKAEERQAFRNSRSRFYGTVGKGEIAHMVCTDWCLALRCVDVGECLASLQLGGRRSRLPDPLLGLGTVHSVTTAKKLRVANGGNSGLDERACASFRHI